MLLCIHGGGFVSGSIYTHRKIFGHLAKAAGARALLADYRLMAALGPRPQLNAARRAARSRSAPPTAGEAIARTQTHDRI